MSQAIVLDSSGGGKLSFAFSMDDKAGAALERMAAGGVGKKPKSGAQVKLVDEAQIRAQIKQNPDLSLQSFVMQGSYGAKGELLMKQIEKNLNKDKEAAASGLYSVTKSGGVSTMRLRLDQRSFKGILGAFPMADKESPLMEFILGVIEETETADDVALDLAAYTGATEKRVRESMLEIRISPPAAIVDAFLVIGGTRTKAVDKGAGLYRIPLVDLFMIDQKPIELVLSWRS